MDQDISKLVAVSTSKRRKDVKHKFERRQIPLEIDDNLTMVVEFADTCAGCEQINGNKQKERERFVQKFAALSKDDVAIALMVTKKEVFNLMSQIVPCVGCRKSVERLFCQLVESGYPALEPLIITKKAELSINVNYLFDAKAIFALFHVHGSKLMNVMESIPKSRKNKRCGLHSLDTHKVRGLGIWQDVWDKLSQDCRDEVVLIDAVSLMETLENYLRKHRFCSDCKSKVLRAYSILVGEVDYSQEKGYCPSLYEGLKCCPQEKHLHVHGDTEFISQLICRAEPELNGSRRERHAKTLDIAQEEVLTCLGIHLYERLHKIWQKLRSEEQTWQILFYLSVEALKKSFEVAVERKQGISNLELMCEELIEEERQKKQKMEQKRQKKKKKKNKNGDKENGDGDKDTCQCDDGASTPAGGSSPSRQLRSSTPPSHCDTPTSCPKCQATQQLQQSQSSAPGSLSDHNANHCHRVAAVVPLVDHHSLDHHPLNHDRSPLRLDLRAQSPPPTPPLAPPPASTSTAIPLNIQTATHCHDCSAVNGTIDRPLSRCLTSSRSDAGYSSGLDGCESCSMPSSNGSDIVCNEEGCNHDVGESSPCSVVLTDVVMACKACQRAGDTTSTTTTYNSGGCNDCCNNGSGSGSGVGGAGGGSGMGCTSRRTRHHESKNVKANGDSSPSGDPVISYGDQSYISLADMLEASCSSEDENGEAAISEEDIQRFRDNRKLLDSKRQELRQTLRKRFDMLCRNGQKCTGVACTCSQKYLTDSP